MILFVTFYFIQCSRWILAPFERYFFIYYCFSLKQGLQMLWQVDWKVHLVSAAVILSAFVSPAELLFCNAVEMKHVWGIFHSSPLASTKPQKNHLSSPFSSSFLSCKGTRTTKEERCNIHLLQSFLHQPNSCKSKALTKQFHALLLPHVLQGAWTQLAAD